MNQPWKESFKIHTYDVDFLNKIKISSLFYYMQGAASNHADSLKFGYQDLLKKNQYWVLSRTKIYFTGLELKADEIQVQTWPTGVDKLFALRDFIITNQNGACLAKAVTAWLIVDSNLHRPVRPDVIKSLLPEYDIPRALDEVPGKITEGSEKEAVFNKKVSYSDIDINQHVNNVRYIEWASDCFSESIYREKKINSFQANFLSELRFGNPVEFHKGNSLQDPNAYYIEGLGNDQGKVFQALIQWE